MSEFSFLESKQVTFCFIRDPVKCDLFKKNCFLSHKVINNLAKDKEQIGWERPDFSSSTWGKEKSGASSHCGTGGEPMHENRSFV